MKDRSIVKQQIQAGRTTAKALADAVNGKNLTGAALRAEVERIAGASHRATGNFISLALAGVGGGK